MGLGTGVYPLALGGSTFGWTSDENTSRQVLDSFLDAGGTPLTARRDAIAMSPEVVAEAIVFAVAQPDLVDIGEIVVRPTVQP